MNVNKLPSTIKSWIKTQTESDIADGSTSRTYMLLASAMAIGVSIVVLIVTGILLSFNYQPNAHELRSDKGEKLFAVRTLRSIIDSDGDTLYLKGQLVLADSITLNTIGKQGTDYMTTPFVRSSVQTSSTSNDNNLIPPSYAYLSTEVLIQEEIRFGNVVRAIHKGAVHCLMFSSLFLFTILILTKTVTSSHTLRWWIFNVMIFACVFSAWSGSILPWDVRSYSALNIGMSITENYVPLVGGWISRFLSYTNTDSLLQRVFVLHSFVLPLAIVVLAHYLRKSTPFIQLKGSSIKATLLTISVTLLVALTLVVLMTTQSYPPFNSLQPSTIHTQPEWYFMGAYTMLNALPEDLAITLLLVVSFVLFIFPIMGSTNRSSNTWLGIAQVVVCLLSLILIGAQMYK